MCIIKTVSPFRLFAEFSISANEMIADLLAVKSTNATEAAGQVLSQASPGLHYLMFHDPGGKARPAAAFAHFCQHPLKMPAFAKSITRWRHPWEETRALEPPSCQDTAGCRGCMISCLGHGQISSLSGADLDL